MNRRQLLEAIAAGAPVIASGNTTMHAARQRPLRHIAVPTLLIHGDADVSARSQLTARRTQAMLTDSTLTIYEGTAHGLVLIHA